MTCVLLVCSVNLSRIREALVRFLREWYTGMAIFHRKKESESAWYAVTGDSRLGTGENDDLDVLLHLNFAKILGEKYLQKLSGK